MFTYFIIIRMLGKIQQLKKLKIRQLKKVGIIRQIYGIINNVIAD